MVPFLKSVARDLREKYGRDMSDIVVVFPNKRASLFLDTYLAEIEHEAIWSPSYITISELFRQNSPLKVADPIKLVCDLHKSFVKCTEIDETLDHFYGWGQMLITDFDDIDKNMADAQLVFSNLKDIHELDDISYLTDDQKKMIQRFFSNFSEDHNSELKKRFLQLWSHFLDIYNDFNSRLAQQGLAYEGALYRQVVTDENLKFEHKKYVFVGFNMLQKVEMQLCDRLMKEEKAVFYWDYDKAYMDNNHEAGHYIRQNLKYFPNELDADSDKSKLEANENGNESGQSAENIYDNLSRKKRINYFSAPTENVQARFVHTWLKENGLCKETGNVAIVLADESLLPTVLHSLPKEVEHVNITIGYPLQQTPFYSLIQQLIQLQGIGHPKASNTYRLHQVLSTLRHPYARYISQLNLQVIEQLESKKTFYPDRSTLIMNEDEGLAILFRDIDKVENLDEYNMGLLNYLIDILKQIGYNTKQQNVDQLFQESLFRSYTVINRLRGLVESGDLKVDTITLERLILQLFQTTSIPFHGEPAVGIQIMGVLETRNLDFDYMLVLSCNEGKWPKGVNDASFIPYSIRKAYGLTTIDNKVAISAYYFYRMIQRCQHLTFTYNNATEEGQTGEMSRFMLQLMIEGKNTVHRHSFKLGQTPCRDEYKEVDKTEAIWTKLNEHWKISPTFINTYMRCEKRFYYRYIEKLEEPDLIDEDEIDNRIFGNIFHRAAQLIYLQFAPKSAVKLDKDGKEQLIHPIIITKADFENAIKNEALIYRIVDQAFREELFKVSSNGYQPKYNGLQLINREVIANYLKQLLVIDCRQAPFTVIGLEIPIETRFVLPTSCGDKNITLSGFIDRLDSVAANGKPGLENMAEKIRVIDYKTGRAPVSHPAEIAEVFNPEMLRKHTDYYLQTILYALIVSQSTSLNPAKDPVSPGLLFIQNARAEDYDPTLKLGRGSYIENVADYKDEFWEGIMKILSDIFNKELPFRPTADKERCAACPYAGLCK